MAKQQTHETYVREVARLAIKLAVDLTPTERASLSAIKLVYGAGPGGARGITYFSRWKAGDETVPFVEVCALGQESMVQVCGTTVHELGHVLAGWSAGHSKVWHDACSRLGLNDIKAAGTDYSWDNFEPRLRAKLEALPLPVDGAPQSLAAMAAKLLPLAKTGARMTLKPCSAGIGTKGGTSRGPGSGSRLRLWQCSCGQKIRAATDELDAMHNPCGTRFEAK